MSEANVRRIVLCMTPLHVLLVRELAKRNERHFDVGIYLAQIQNDKAMYYASVLSECANEHYFKVMPAHPRGGVSKYASIWKSRRDFSKWLRSFGCFDEAYAPSSDNDLLYTFANTYSGGKLLTYDDGLASINPLSSFATTRPSFKNKIFYQLSGAGCWPERLVRRSATHFSVYAAQNIFHRVERISFHAESTQTGKNEDAISRELILLGAAPEAPQHVLHALQRFAMNENPTWYLPHPRWVAPDADMGQKLVTNLILEDYILSRLAVEPNLHFEVVGYESSALINVANLARVKAYTLMPENDPLPVRAVMAACGVKPWPERCTS